MPNVTRPILHNGFVLPKGVSVVKRLEQVFFSEVYLLSNSEYLYLLVNLTPDQIIGRSNNELIFIEKNGRKYIGVQSPEYSHDKIKKIIDKLTLLRGLDCVAGMKQLKSLLVNDVINPLINPEKYKKFKLSIPNGILLYGPPGCGKTYIVKKLAEQLDYSYIELSPSYVATPYVHGAVSNIAKTFELAKLKAPSIIFIDEIEGLFPKREELGAHADIKKEEINEFLIQLNNAGKNKVLVIGATNRPHIIDTAILRSGRMDKRIYVSPPDLEARIEMLKLSLSGRPYDRNIDFDYLAKISDNYVCSDIELIVTEAARIAVARNSELINQEMISEAMSKFSVSVSEEEINYYKSFHHLTRW